MQQVAEAMGAAKKRQQMDYKGMEEVDDGMYIYSGDDETMANTAMNVCVTCSSNDKAMTELARSHLISRAGWTDEEHAAGHVLVAGDGSTTSQVPMEVKGETERGVNSKTGKKQSRGNKHSKKNRNKQHATNTYNHAHISLV